MATSKQGFLPAVEPQHSVSVQSEDRMQAQAPLPTVYVHGMPDLSQCPQALVAASQDPGVISLPVAMVCAKQTLPFLTLHIASGTSHQQPRPGLSTSSPRPKSAGRHVCPHCSRDCMKPSVLEKHLRCHTGERPYPCHICGISFKTQSNLYKHKRTQAHARLSSESEKGAFSSQESLQSSMETCSPSPSLETTQTASSGSLERSDSISTPTASSSVLTDASVGKTLSDTEWALKRAALVGLIIAPTQGQQEIRTLNQARETSLQSQSQRDSTIKQSKSSAADGHAPLTPSRIPLQRQEATLFSKVWESPLSRGKSQSYDSTDSGFSDSSEQHWTSSPGGVLHDPSMESLAESVMEHQERPVEDAQTGPETSVIADRTKVSVQEKRKLEERISKLISENDAVVDDKHLENVRPRKTVLSKQGSIDLPMPYTYKDSFHFEMPSSKHAFTSQKPDRLEKQALYSSVPTQHSESIEHAPLTRSCSLPFSVGSPHHERANTASPQRENSQLGRRCSAGNIYPLKYPAKSVVQQAPGHRSLVRQTAVDVLPAGAGSLESSSLSSLSSDGDSADPAAEPGSKRCNRKKSPKFAYNKWYMYGAGTFKKLYSKETDGALKSRKPTTSFECEHSSKIQVRQQKDCVLTLVSKENLPSSLSTKTISQSSFQTVSVASTVNTHPAQISGHTVSSNTPQVGLLVKKGPEAEQLNFSGQSNIADPIAEPGFIQDLGEERAELIPQLFVRHFPSERKKQRTEETACSLIEKTLDPLTCGIKHANIYMRNKTNQPLQSTNAIMNDRNQRATSTPEQIDNSQQNSLLRHSLNQLHPSLKRQKSIVSLKSAPGSCSLATCVSAATRTSFLPKYQLKIPSMAEGGPGPGLIPAQKQNSSSSTQSIIQSHRAPSLNQPMESSPASEQHQPTTTAPAYVQSQPGTVIISAPSLSKTAVSHSVQKYQTIFTIASAQHDFIRPSSVSPRSATPMIALKQCESAATVTDLVQKKSCTDVTACVQRQSVNYRGSEQFTISNSSGANHSATVIKASQENEITAQITSSPPFLTSSSTKTTQNQATVSSVTSMQRASSTPMDVLMQPSVLRINAPSSTSVNALDGISADATSTAFQVARFEENAALLNGSSQLVAQDTFFVRTAELQIVMQLISDEQLAQIQPQIEKPQNALGTGCAIIHQSPVTSESCLSLGNDQQDICKSHSTSDTGNGNGSNHQVVLDLNRPNNSEKSGIKQKILSQPGQNTSSQLQRFCLTRATLCSIPETESHASVSSGHGQHKPGQRCKEPKKHGTTSGSYLPLRSEADQVELPSFPHKLTEHGASSSEKDTTETHHPAVSDQIQTRQSKSTHCATNHGPVSIEPRSQETSTGNKLSHESSNLSCNGGHVLSSPDNVLCKNGVSAVIGSKTPEAGVGSEKTPAQSGHQQLSVSHPFLNNHKDTISTSSPQQMPFPSMSSKGCTLQTCCPIDKDLDSTVKVSETLVSTKISQDFDLASESVLSRSPIPKHFASIQVPGKLCQTGRITTSTSITETTPGSSLFPSSKEEPATPSTGYGVRQPKLTTPTEDTQQGYSALGSRATGITHLCEQVCCPHSDWTPAATNGQDTADNRPASICVPQEVPQCGTQEGGSHQSSQLQEPRTRSQGLILWHLESEGSGKKDCTGTAETNNICQGRERHRKDKREETNTYNHMGLVTRPHVASTSSVCSIHDKSLFRAQGQCDSLRDSAQVYQSDTSIPHVLQPVGQSETGTNADDCGVAYSQHRLSSPAAELNTVSLPLPTVGHPQTQVQKEAFKGNVTHSSAPLAGISVPQHKGKGLATQTSASGERCPSSQADTVCVRSSSVPSASSQPCGSRHTHSLNSSSAHNTASHTSQTSVTPPHTAPQTCAMEKSQSLPKDEECTSSSDDEGKLVIEDE